MEVNPRRRGGEGGGGSTRVFEMVIVAICFATSLARVALAQNLLDQA